MRCHDPAKISGKADIYDVFFDEDILPVHEGRGSSNAEPVSSLSREFGSLARHGLTLL